MLGSKIDLRTYFQVGDESIDSLIIRVGELASCPFVKQEDAEVICDCRVLYKSYNFFLLWFKVEISSYWTDVLDVIEK